MTSAFLIQNELMPRKVFDASRMASRQASSNPARDDRPGRAECYDCEYVRNGTANLFMAFEPLGGWREVAVTDRLTCMLSDKRSFAELAELTSPLIDPDPVKLPPLAT